MEERVIQELSLLRKHYPNLEYITDGRWIRIPAYLLPIGWSSKNTDISFQIKVCYPGTAPYGFYVPIGLTYQSKIPQSYQESIPLQPPFEGKWGFFSWAPDANQWRPTGDLVTGSNLLNWVRGFNDRFLQGE